MTTDDTSRKSILDQLLDCVHSVLKWGTEQLESTCPAKWKEPSKRCGESRSAKAEVVVETDDIGPPCTQKWTPPSQICPKTVSCCYIKMQDPYAPCCCEPIKPQPPPCPPKCRRRRPREPTCGCDLCKKSHPGGHRCCGDRGSVAPEHLDR